MKTLSRMLKRFWSDQEGLETVEYAVIAALITGAAIVAITALGAAVATSFNNLVALLP